MALTIMGVGLLVMVALGFVAKRRPSRELEDWTVGGRRFSALTTWFLQAGEFYSTFTFLGLSGLAFVGGVAAMYAIPYLPLAFVGLYFLAPRVWRLGKQHRYLTQADFFEDRYRSRALGMVVAALGVIFLVPYVELQVTGLGVIVRVVAGPAVSPTLSMVVAFALTVAFVLWSGVKGTAYVAYFKDALMIFALVAVSVAIPLHVAGGLGGLFGALARKRPALLTIHHGPFGPAWFLSSILVSLIGAQLTLPQAWPAVLSARSEQTLRRNYTFLPLYAIGQVLPMLAGFAGVLLVTGKVNPNALLLLLTRRLLPPWLLGITGLAGMATAMVPVAGQLIGISSTLAKNLVRANSPRTTFVVNQVAVVVVTAAAVFFGIVGSPLLADLLLLTFSGLAQLAPGVLAGVYLDRWRPSASSLLAGIAAGEGVVAWLSLSGHAITAISPGILGLVANLVVLAVAEGGRRLMVRSRSTSGAHSL